VAMGLFRYYTICLRATFYTSEKALDIKQKKHILIWRLKTFPTPNKILVTRIFLRLCEKLPRTARNSSYSS